MPRPKKSPAYQWYPQDYMADPVVQLMTLEQEGAYRRLLDVCWLERGLPTSIDELWRLAKAPSKDAFTRRIWNVVGSKFWPRKGKLQHRRLDRERAKQAKTRQARQLAAQKSWKNRGSKSNANASRLQSLSSSSSSSLSSSDLKPAPVAPEDWFTECRRLHDGKCGGQYAHHVQKQLDAGRSAGKAS